MNDGLYGLLQTAIEKLPQLIGAIGGTAAAVLTLKNGWKATERNTAQLEDTREKFKAADKASVERTNAVVRKLNVSESKIDANTAVTHEAKEQAGAAFEVGAHGLSVANGINQKFFDMNERIERHRLANIEQVRIFSEALTALQAQLKPPNAS